MFESLRLAHEPFRDTIMNGNHMTWPLGDDIHSHFDLDPSHSMFPISHLHDPLSVIPPMDPLVPHMASNFETQHLFSHDFGETHSIPAEFGQHSLPSDSHDHHTDISFGSSSDKTDDHWRDEMKVKHYEDDAKRDADKAAQALKDGDADKAAMHLRWAEREADMADMHRDFMKR